MSINNNCNPFSFGRPNVWLSRGITNLAGVPETEEEIPATPSNPQARDLTDTEVAFQFLARRLNSTLSK